MIFDLLAELFSEQIIFECFLSRLKFCVMNAALTTFSFYGREDMMQRFVIDNIFYEVERNVRLIEVAVDANEF